MCEANAFFVKEGNEEMILEGVDLVEPQADGQFRLVNIFGEQKIVNGRLKVMNLVEHRILFEA
ncbi:MAG: CooT family nickel-binding protein [Deltaproteobacteria bacterium]|nr:CooT family nickel-binding protein [Deltaproteobacteria bacterium]